MMTTLNITRLPDRDDGFTVLAEARIAPPNKESTLDSYLVRVIQRNKHDAPTLQWFSGWHWYPDDEIHGISADTLIALILAIPTDQVLSFTTEIEDD